MDGEQKMIIDIITRAVVDIITRAVVCIVLCVGLMAACAVGHTRSITERFNECVKYTESAGACGVIVGKVFPTATPTVTPEAK